MSFWRLNYLTAWRLPIIIIIILNFDIGRVYFLFQFRFIVGLAKFLFIYSWFCTFSDTYIKFKWNYLISEETVIKRNMDWLHGHCSRRYILRSLKKKSDFDAIWKEYWRKLSNSIFKNAEIVPVPENTEKFI